MEPEKKNGALVGLTIIVIILVIGAIYIWQSNKNSPTQPDTTTRQDSAELDTLEADISGADTSTGVDANTVH